MGGAVGYIQEELVAYLIGNGFGGDVVPVLVFDEGFVVDEFAEDVAMQEEGVFALVSVSWIQ